MSRPFQRVRSLMYENGLKQTDVARALLVSEHTVSDKLNGHTEWTLSEMYRLLGLFGQPDEELHNLFPPNGCNDGEGRRWCRKLG